MNTASQVHVDADVGRLDGGSLRRGHDPLAGADAFRCHFHDLKSEQPKRGARSAGIGVLSYFDKV